MKIQKVVYVRWWEVEDVFFWWILFSLLSRRLSHLLKMRKEGMNGMSKI